MRYLQVHFNYKNIEDFVVVKSKTKRLTLLEQFNIKNKFAKLYDADYNDINLTHYFVFND
jgi:hypothetical protein